MKEREKREEKEKQAAEVFSKQKGVCFEDGSLFNYPVHAVIQEMRPCKIEKVCVHLQTPSMRGQR